MRRLRRFHHFVLHNPLACFIIEALLALNGTHELSKRYMVINQHAQNTPILPSQLRASSSQLGIP